MTAAQRMRAALANAGHPEGCTCAVCSTISSVSPFDGIRQSTDEGREYWSARALMPLLGYEKWERFADAVGRAKLAAHNAGYVVAEHFPGAGKMVETGSGAQRRIDDFHLSRYACYLVALNGDPRKAEIAAAQNYFVIKTRQAEIAEQRSQSPEEQMALGLIAAQQMIEQRDARIQQLETKAATDAPKVTYVDVYVTDADLLSFSTVASTNGVKESALRDLLIRKQWIYKQTDSRWSNTEGRKVERNRYSEKADKKRYFRRVENHDAPRFRGSEVMHTLKVTPQGAEAIARLIAKEAAA